MTALFKTPPVKALSNLHWSYKLAGGSSVGGEDSRLFAVFGSESGYRKLP